MPREEIVQMEIDLCAYKYERKVFLDNNSPLPSSTNEGQYYAVIMSCLRSSANVDASLHSYARRLILHWRRRQQLLVVRQLLAETRHNFMINQGEGGVERIFFDEV